ncbi:LysR family transcriptional regulator [Reinekea sp.]|jgi:DNA-binding transcriptional LysR family regulator|uniref:LysR family transcriptional regulator n=1 Tax=Reinekea sp. TaxID=1970455 RepID=UPI003989AD3B
MHLNSITRLRYFNDIAITGSFSKSAERLGIAQPALSIAIKKLEEETGLKLINRNNRAMSLTSDGKVLLKHVHQILENLADAGRELTELQGLEKGIINIGAPAMISTYFLPAILLGFKSAYPGIRIRLVEGGTQTLEQMVCAGKLDLALLQHDEDNNDIRFATKLSDQVLVCVPVDHQLAEKTSITIEEFSQHPLVMFREGYFLRDSVETRARNAKVSLDIQFETNLIGLLMRLVRDEVGVATCLAMIVENEPLLCVRSFDPPIHLDMAWGWKRNQYLSKAAQVFLTFYDQHSKL